MSRRMGLIIALAVLAPVLSLIACGKENTTSPAPAPELDSPPLLGATNGSENYIHVFAGAGVYPYHCTFHTTAHYRMAGTVVVDDQGSDSAFVSIFQGAYHPETATVRPGGQVRWQNFDDGTHHTVTSD